MTVRLECVTKDNYRELYDFEKKNKDFFETLLPPRNEGYYHYDTFIEIMDALMAEQNQGEYYMYIIRDLKNNLVGRINLQLCKGDVIKEAEVGYRLDYDFQGLGYASQALKVIKHIAFNELSVVKLTAGTAKDNEGSKRVLEKNGFKKIGEEANVLKINNIWVDGILYSLEK